MSNINRFMDIAQFASLVTVVLWTVFYAERNWSKWRRHATDQAKRAWAKTAAPVALAKAVKG